MQRRLRRWSETVVEHLLSLAAEAGELENIRVGNGRQVDIINLLDRYQKVYFSDPDLHRTRTALQQMVSRDIRDIEGSIVLVLYAKKQADLAKAKIEREITSEPTPAPTPTPAPVSTPLPEFGLEQILKSLIREVVQEEVFELNAKLDRILEKLQTKDGDKPFAMALNRVDPSPPNDTDTGNGRKRVLVVGIMPNQIAPLQKDLAASGLDKKYKVKFWERDSGIRTLADKLLYTEEVILMTEQISHNISDVVKASGVPVRYANGANSSILTALQQ